MIHRVCLLTAALGLLSGCVAAPPKPGEVRLPREPQSAPMPPASVNPVVVEPAGGAGRSDRSARHQTSAAATAAGDSGTGSAPGSSPPPGTATSPANPVAVGSANVPGEMPPPPPREVLVAIGDAQPRVEQRTRRGNPPVYTVLGQTYELLRSAAGYRERGVASWYGPDFHAKSTSNGEPYDMYAMTAAHRTLPIPVYLKVTNLANGKSVVVRVNDRGPFKHNRIVDLSYTAAMKLDMRRKGTALVEVEAILPPGDDGLLPEMTPEMLARAPRAPSVPKLTALATGGLLYAQVGAFGVEENAFGLQDRLKNAGIDNVLVVRAQVAGRALWRVRIGPIGSVEDYDAVVDRLERFGIRDISLARLEVPSSRDKAEAAD